MTAAKRIAEIKVRAEAATREEWQHTYKPGREEAREWLLGQFDASDGDGIHGVGVAAPGKTITEACLSVAITGNGPTSKANAIFLTHSRADVDWLIARLERAEQLLGRVHANVEETDDTYPTIREIGAFLAGEDE